MVSVGGARITGRGELRGARSLGGGRPSIFAMSANLVCLSDSLWQIRFCFVARHVPDVVNEEETSGDCWVTPHLRFGAMMSYNIEGTVISWISSYINILE